MADLVIPRGCDGARVIRVIETEAMRGDGGDETPERRCRTVKQYWSFDGELLAEYDPTHPPSHPFGATFTAPIEFIGKFVPNK